VDDITSETVTTFIENGGANSGKAKRINLGEDNDPDLEINPVAQAQLQFEKEKAKEKARREKERARKATAASPLGGRLSRKTKSKAIKTDGARRLSTKKKAMDILKIDSSQLPRRANDIAKQAAEMEAGHLGPAGLKEIDAEIQRKAEKAQLLRVAQEEAREAAEVG